MSERVQLRFVIAAHFICYLSFELPSIFYVNIDLVRRISQQLFEIGFLSVLLRTPINKIDGDSTVEVHDCPFTKRKPSAGTLLPQQWKFRRICRETYNCFTVNVQDGLITRIICHDEDCWLRSVMYSRL